MKTIARVKFDYSIKFTKEMKVELNKVIFGDRVNESDLGENLWSTFTMLIEDAVKFGHFTVLELLPERMREQMIEQRHETVINEKCNVVVPSLGLLVIDTVKVHYDLCTEDLQQHLDKGWRIVAICVQPDQRRPDYILGKTLNT